MVKELNIQNIKELNLSEKVNESYDFIKQVKDGKIKPRELKIPRKAKVRKGKLRKGWIGVIKLDENGNLSGDKVRISGSAFNTKEGLYHATDGREICFWNGKFPVLFQQTWRKNPMNLRMKEGEKNETYGDPYIKAKILKDVIKVKKGGGGIVLWILIAIGAYIGYQALTGGI